MDRKKTNSVAMVLLAILTILAILPAEAAAYTYDRQVAVNYALSNWDKAVPGSSYFGAKDCTNFVSNSLKAGGWPETMKPLTYSQHLSFQTNPYAWYADFWRNWYSYTWGGADNFGKFISIYSGRGQARALTGGPSSWQNYFKIGDIVQIDYEKYGIWDHTMIVTKIDSSNMYMTYHSPSQHDERLTDIMSRRPNAKFLGYQIYDQFSR